MSLENQYYSPGQDIHFIMTTFEEEQALWVKARAGDEKAKVFLISNHLLFAAMQAQSLVQGALPKDEVISAANLAVMKAYQTFEPHKGFRFTTYLRPFIRGEISQLWRSKFNGDVPDPSIRSYELSGGIDNESSCYMRGELIEEHEGEARDQRRFNIAKLNAALETLSARDRELIERVYLGEENLAKVARDRGVSRAAVQATHARLMIKLQRILKKEGVTL